MEISELKERDWFKVLLEGESGTGKTLMACRVVLRVLDEGGRVLYLDSEAEGTTTLLQVIDNQGYDEGVIERLSYKQVETYEALMSGLGDMGDYDLVVVDTLDHKHTMTLKEVTDAKMKSEADWNQYPKIYSTEKQMMETIGKPDCNILCTLDPESGSSNKPKGAQTNVRGYFTAVVNLYKDGDSWTHKIENWVGRGDLIGSSINNIGLDEAIETELNERL